jgi:hypothetical protein
MVGCGPASAARLARWFKGFYESSFAVIIFLKKVLKPLAVYSDVSYGWV